MHEIKIGDRVERLAADYTAGRLGNVIEAIPAIGKWPARLRVHWDSTSAWQSINIRTWCLTKTLKKCKTVL